MQTDHVRNKVLQKKKDGKKYLTNNKKKDGKLDWSHLAQELLSKGRKDKAKDRVKERGGRRRKQLLHGLKEKSGY